jgi:NADH-quinone oxidoreductase subunit L
VLAYAWVIPALPLAAYVLIVFLGRPLGEGAAWFGIVALGIATALAFGVLAQVAGGASVHLQVPWLDVGGVHVPMGIRVGPMEAAVAAMVTFVSWMIQIYSTGYMHGDARFRRFFANVNLFVAGMLTVVFADNFLLFFAAWEIMGLCSYLLIGHWYEDPNNARAATKAFLVTRIGDVGLLAGIWWAFSVTGTFDFDRLPAGLQAAHLSPGALTAVALLIFLGAVGKSAQVPLQIWLPDAMAGPTPVSALIHAATRVAAGVFLVARTYGVFALAPAALAVVAYVGSITAFLAATVATVQEDIKKVLAYSTISQLGYMMLGLGVGSLVAGLFHLITHAFFKALLFLAAGSVIHAVEEQNMHRMGGLLGRLPSTAVTFVVGSLALAGIVPLSGFYSKDAILAAAYRSPYPLPFWLALAAAGLTAYYMTRAVVLTFLGRPRDERVHAHAHESPAVMVGPLWVLAVPAALLGLAATPVRALLLPEGGAEEAVPGVVVATQLLALAGIAAGAALYLGPEARRRAAIRALRPLYVLFKEKWYFDHLGLAVAYAGLAASWVVGAWDRYVVDGLVNGAAALVRWAGGQTRQLAVGSAQAYMLTLLLAVAVGLIALQLIGG